MHRRGGGANTSGSLLWDGDTTICEMRVTYTRKDGGIVEVPAANIFRMRDGLVHDYRIFVDNAAVYA